MYKAILCIRQIYGLWLYVFLNAMEKGKCNGKALFFGMAYFI